MQSEEVLDQPVTEDEADDDGAHGFCTCGCHIYHIARVCLLLALNMSNGVYSIVPVRNRQGQPAMPFHGVHRVQHRLQNINYSVCI